MERDPRAVVRPVSEGRFLTLLSVRSNLANLNLDTAVMQQKRPRGLILYPPAAKFPSYIYNKVYSPAMGVLSLRIYRKTESVCVKVNVIVKVLGIRAVVS